MACFLAVYASSPTSRPVNGNTRYRRAGYAFVGRDFHPLDSFKRFHYLIRRSSSSKLFPTR